MTAISIKLTKPLQLINCTITERNIHNYLGNHVYQLIKIIIIIVTVPVVLTINNFL